MKDALSARGMSWSGFALVLIAAVLAGCSGNKRQVVNGTVTHGGQPIGPCFIHLHGPADHLVMAIVSPEGTFAVTDVLPGEYKVTFAIDDNPGTGSPGWRKTPTKKARPKKSIIPPKYLKVETTDLVYTIAPEIKQLAIEIP